MALKKVDMNELSDAVESWFSAYAVDFVKSDPQTLIMDGTQDERVIACCLTVLINEGAEVTWN